MCEILPDSSSALQVTTVSPNGNTSGALLSIIISLIASSAIGRINSTMLLVDDVASTVIFSGCNMLGAVVSTTVTNCVSDTEFPEVSVAVQVTIVSPNGNDSGASLATCPNWILSDQMATPISIMFE